VERFFHGDKGNLVPWDMAARITCFPQMKSLSNILLKTYQPVGATQAF
jgi:hypothetical protein